MIENIRLSMKGILGHKLRSFLTMLGIIIGITAIIVIVSMIEGTNKRIENNLIGDGTNTVEVQLYVDGWPQDFSYSDVPDGVPVFSEDIKEKILNAGGTEAVSLYHKRTNCDSIYRNNTQISSCSVYGVDQDYISVKGLEIVEGRGISKSDLENNRKVVVLDKTALANGFEGGEAVGKTIDIMGEPFEVIGIADKKIFFEPVINSIDDYNTYKQTENGAIYIPDRVWPVIFKYDEPLEILVKAKSTMDMTRAGKAAEDILNGYLKVSDGADISYRAKDLAKEASQLQQLSASTNMMVMGVASLSLLVGGLGVMNIMLVSVTERTREIGLKKALGAKKRTIRAQFLTEAAVLSIIGGILGVIAGVIVANIVAAVESIPVIISMPTVLISVLISMAIGIGFGIAPALKASDLNPIDALRYE